MPRYAFRATSGTRPEVWRVFDAEHGQRDTEIRGVRIRHVLQVRGQRDHGLTAVAEAQWTLVHLKQLLALGFGRGSVAHRVRTGALCRILPSVFGVAGSALEPPAIEVAALLSVGDDCVVSHASAAALWGLAPRPSGLVTLTLAGRRVRDRPGVRIHRVHSLDARDVRLRDGLPVTAPARAIIDFAGEAGFAETERALAEARVQRLVTDRAIKEALERAHGRTGTATVRALLDNNLGLTRSEAERRLLRLVAQAGLPLPETNVRLQGFEVDFLWRAARLVVEVDGQAFHAHRRAFERDRRRDQALVAAGYRVIRVTWRQLEREPLAVLARIAQALMA